MRIFIVISGKKTFMTAVIYYYSRASVLYYFGNSLELNTVDLHSSLQRGIPRPKHTAD